MRNREGFFLALSSKLSPLYTVSCALFTFTLQHPCIKISNSYFCFPFRKAMTAKKRRIVTMTTGIAVALAIICSQLFYSQSLSFQKKETKTEQHQQENSDDQDQVSITVPSTSLPSSAYTELNPNVFYLFDILFEESASDVPELIL